MTITRVFLAVLIASALLSSPTPAVAIEEADRLWLVGERAFLDGLHPLARRMLERLVERHPNHPRIPDAVFILGKARLAAGDAAPALEAFRRAQTFTPPPGRPEEARFWEGETLFRMKRFAEARGVFDKLLATTPTSPMAPDALYGLAWAQLEMRQREAAVSSFRQLVEGFPDHEVTPSATVQLARLLIDAKRHRDAATVLEPFAQRHPQHRLAPEARYLAAVARVSAGQVTEGVEGLRAVIIAYPRHDVAVQARRVVIDTLLREGKKSDLAEEYRTLMALSPRTPEALYDAGVIAARIARPREASEAWELLRTDFPEHPLAGRAALDLAQAAFGKNAYKDAASLARAATKADEHAIRAQAFLLVGESELKLKRYAPAHQAFQAAADAAGQDKAVRFRALAGSGLALEEQRQWAQAVKYYQEVASESPDKELRTWAQSRRAQAAAHLKPPPKADTPKGGKK